MGEIKTGIKCKACDKVLSKGSIDPELCNECMEVVMDYNRDVIDKVTASDLEKLLNGGDCGCT